MNLFKRKHKPKPPTEAEAVRARVNALADAMTANRPAVRKHLQIVSSDDLERELSDHEEDTPPRGTR